MIRDWRLIAIASLLVSAGCQRRPTAAEDYRDAVRALRNGNAPQSLSLARLSAKTCGPEAECRWIARLLEAEILLTDDQLDAADAILAERPPDGKQFAHIEARRRWLMGDLAFSRGQADRAEELLARPRRWLQLQEPGRSNSKRA